MVPLTSGAGGRTYIIADHSGQAYYVECAHRHLDCLEIGRDTDRPYQCAANHFVNPRMLPSMSKKGVHSILRYNALNRWIEAHRGRITLDTLARDAAAASAQMGRAATTIPPTWAPSARWSMT